ncbi:hypothetical protein SSIL_3819 (plasmid) [Solibacillus silvestris StLB046]|uniref:Uncharacterized protein n=1 Tax=Solibacillus silvestris (strain StLB046) TaxID=1002809 RepID=F2FAU8_SOLSS|nr:hypothetical protein [Solibacillus silvestris]BAK18242.1 hypothetical protein SSIL_3819 [Solibacillus silvestris StLB046]
MENLSRVERKKKEKEESKRKCISKGLTTLRALIALPRIIALFVNAWNFCKEYFSDLFL